jgi:hypothetical protein
MTKGRRECPRRPKFEAAEPLLEFPSEEQLPLIVPRRNGGAVCALGIGGEWPMKAADERVSSDGLGQPQQSNIYKPPSVK